MRSNPAKWVMMPAFAKPRRKVQLERIDAAFRMGREPARSTSVVRKGAAVGVVCAGAAYQHVVEALPGCIGVQARRHVAACPRRRCANSQAGVDALYVVEEGFDLPDRCAYARWAFASPHFPCALAARRRIEPRPYPCGVRTRGSRACAGACRRSGPPARVVRRLPASSGVQGAFAHAKPSSRATSDATRWALCRRFPPWTPCIDMGASVSMSHGFELALGRHRAPPRCGRHRRLHLRPLRSLGAHQHRVQQGCRDASACSTTVPPL